jgi:hypothetical protein
LVKERDCERKLRAVRADLEADEVEHFDLLKDKLGDLAGTPLGQAAVARASGDTLETLMQAGPENDGQVKH